MSNMRQGQHSTTIEPWLKVEQIMGKRQREREAKRKEVRLRETLAVLDVIEWALRRLREILGS